MAGVLREMLAFAFFALGVGATNDSMPALSLLQVHAQMLAAPVNKTTGKGHEAATRGQNVTRMKARSAKHGQKDNGTHANGWKKHKTPQLTEHDKKLDKAQPVGILHMVGNCDQCNRELCSVVAKEEPNVETAYTTGSSLQDWGCSNLPTQPIVVKSSDTEVFYVVETAQINIQCQGGWRYGKRNGGEDLKLAGLFDSEASCQKAAYTVYPDRPAVQWNSVTKKCFSKDVAGELDSSLTSWRSCEILTPTQGSCSFFACPIAYELKTGAAAISCTGPVCVAGDRDTCCQYMVECLPDRVMSFGKAEVVRNNLGGKGPYMEQEEGMLIHGIFPNGNPNYSLMINAVSNYKPFNVAKNGKLGSFFQMNMRTDGRRSYELNTTFTFVDRFSLKPIVIPSFLMTFFDLDEMKNGFGREYIRVQNVYLSADATPETHVSMDDADGQSTFRSTQFGNVQDNPIDARVMTQLQKDRSESFTFPSLSSFTLALGVGQLPQGWTANGRMIVFSGASSVDCEGFATCDTMQCPRGWHLREVPFVPSRNACSGPVCTQEDDLDTCCRSGCEAGHIAFGDVAYNNLDGQGPEEGTSSGMRFQNVKPGMDFVVTANVPPPYHPWDVMQNGPAGQGLLGINFENGATANLTFTFVKSGTDIPAEPHSFYFSVLDLDEMKNGKAKESVTVSGYEDYFLSQNSEVIVSRTAANATARTFSSSTKGTALDNPTDAMHLTQLQEDRTVSFYFLKANSVTISVGAQKGKAGRNLFFAGATGLTCSAIGS